MNSVELISYQEFLKKKLKLTNKYIGTKLNFLDCFIKYERFKHFHNRESSDFYLTCLFMFKGKIFGYNDNMKSLLVVPGDEVDIDGLIEEENYIDFSSWVLEKMEPSTRGLTLNYIESFPGSYGFRPRNDSYFSPGVSDCILRNTVTGEVIDVVIKVSLSTYYRGENYPIETYKEIIVCCYPESIKFPIPRIRMINYCRFIKNILENIK